MRRCGAVSRCAVRASGPRNRLISGYPRRFSVNLAEPDRGVMRTGLRRRVSDTSGAHLDCFMDSLDMHWTKKFSEKIAWIRWQFWAAAPINNSVEVTKVLKPPR